MLYAPSVPAMTIFCILVGVLLALSVRLGHRGPSPAGTDAAPGDWHWFVHGMAYAGDFLSGGMLLGICGLIAFYGFDGFLYAIGLMAGWVAARFVIAEPLRRLGKVNFTGVLESRFDSRGLRLAAAISILVVSIAFLIPELVAAGTLLKPLLGLPAFSPGPGIFADGRFVLNVVLAGAFVLLLVLTTGGLSTTWARFLRGSLLVAACGILTLLLFGRGFAPKNPAAFPRRLSNDQIARQIAPQGKVIWPTGPWLAVPYLRLQMDDGSISTWRYTSQSANPPQLEWPSMFIECETATQEGGITLINGKPQTADHDLQPVAFFCNLPGDATPDRPLGPRSFLTVFQDSDIASPASDRIAETIDGKDVVTTLYYPRVQTGGDILSVGGHPSLFPALVAHRQAQPASFAQDRLNFVSLMLALFCGTSALPHLLRRPGAAKDQPAARKSAFVGITAIGLFLVLTLYLGVGAMTTGRLDPGDTNAALPLLAKSFGDLAWAPIAAILFLALVGTVSDLILAAAGAVAQDLMPGLAARKMDDHAKVRAGKIAALLVGISAMILSLAFQKMNAAFLIGWAFNIAASANLPAVTMLLFWKRATPQALAASILVGLLSSLAWILLSPDAFHFLYGCSADAATKLTPVPFNQPALVTMPLACLTLIAVNLFTSPPARD